MYPLTTIDKAYSMVIQDEEQRGINMQWMPPSCLFWKLATMEAKTIMDINQGLGTMEKAGVFVPFASLRGIRRKLHGYPPKHRFHKGTGSSLSVAFFAIFPALPRLSSASSPSMMNRSAFFDLLLLLMFLAYARQFLHSKTNSTVQVKHICYKLFV